MRLRMIWLGRSWESSKIVMTMSMKMNSPRIRCSTKRMSILRVRYKMERKKRALSTTRTRRKSMMEMKSRMKWKKMAIKATKWSE